MLNKIGHSLLSVCTKMHSIKYKRKIFVSCGVALILYILLSAKNNEVQLDGFIKNTDPREVWEFVADFSNMKKLNPTILDFTILSEAGNYDHWEYSVDYLEYLHFLPFIHNRAVAHFQVKPIPKIGYTISSKHKTCFVWNSFCLHSWSNFNFNKNGSHTYCLEHVTYECPRIMSTYCKAEVMFQRRSILSNLIKTFNT